MTRSSSASTPRPPAGAAAPLGVRLEDLDPDRCLVKLREKGSTVRWQSVTPAPANCFVDHAGARGAVLSTDPLLRYRDGQPLTSRRYGHL